MVQMRIELKLSMSPSNRSHTRIYVCVYMCGDGGGGVDDEKITLSQVFNLISGWKIESERKFKAIKKVSFVCCLRPLRMADADIVDSIYWGRAS